MCWRGDQGIKQGGSLSGLLVALNLTSVSMEERVEIRPGELGCVGRIVQGNRFCPSPTITRLTQTLHYKNSHSASVWPAVAGCSFNSKGHQGSYPALLLLPSFVPASAPHPKSHCFLPSLFIVLPVSLTSSQFTTTTSATPS